MDYHSSLRGNPEIFGRTQPFIGTATPFSLEYEYSNPFSLSALNSRKSPTRPALPGAVSHAGVQQQPLHFLPLAFRPCRNCPKTCDSEACPNQPHVGPTWPALAQSRVFSRPSPASPDTGPHRGQRRPTALAGPIRFSCPAAGFPPTAQSSTRYRIGRSRRQSCPARPASPALSGWRGRWGSQSKSTLRSRGSP